MAPKRRKPTQDGGVSNKAAEKALPASRHPRSGAYEVQTDGKSVACHRYGSITVVTGLIFTHGAGGGISTPATKSFVEGFSQVSPVVAFEGSMNLKSRTKAFHAVVEDAGNESVALGGRSMGARAAVIAAAEHGTTDLILVSYPLVGQNGAVRDEILLDIDPNINILFISGDADNMCSIEQLNEVRSRMQAKTSLAVVQGADHGMSLKPKAAVDSMREYTGKLAATWLQSKDRIKTECQLSWDDEQGEVIDKGWQKRGVTASNSNQAQPKAAKQKEQSDEEETKRPVKRRRKR